MTPSSPSPRPEFLEELRKLAEAVAPLYEKGRTMQAGEYVRLLPVLDQWKAAANPTAILQLIDLLQEKVNP